MRSTAINNADASSSANPRSSQAPGASLSRLVSDATVSKRSKVCVCTGASAVQFQRADRPCHRRRLDPERRIMIGIEGAQLSLQPSDESFVAREPGAIGAARVILERLLRYHDADHPRALARAKRVGTQAPGGEDHHVLTAARHQDARIAR